MLYYRDGGIILKKLDKFFKQHPFYFLFGLAIGLILLHTLVNVIQHCPIFDEIEQIFYVIGIFLISEITAKLTHNIYIRFGVSFIVNFAYLSIQMFFDGSYVNYTSFIVTGGVAVFIALLMVWMMHSFDKLFEN